MSGHPSRAYCVDGALWACGKCGCMEWNADDLNHRDGVIRIEIGPSCWTYTPLESVVDTTGIDDEGIYCAECGSSFDGEEPCS